MDIVKEKRVIALPKKISWILLALYFLFDNIVSYIAVTRMGGRELNWVIAPFVEKYPLLYFVCIPAELIGAYIIVLFFRKWINEKIILTAAVIYWPIANSSGNLLFILGFRHVLTVYRWAWLTLAALLAALIYGIYSLRLLRK